MKINIIMELDDSYALRKLLSNLSKKTKLKEDYIKTLLHIYQKFALANGDHCKHMTQRQFALLYQVYFNVSDVTWMDSLITCIDPKSKDTISPEAFVKVIDLWMNGSLQDKIKFCFNVYDRHATGFISREKMFKYCRYMLFAGSAEETDDLVTDFVEFILKRMDVDRDGRISFEDYTISVQQHPWLLEFIGQIIPDMDFILDVFD